MARWIDQTPDGPAYPYPNPPAASYLSDNHDPLGGLGPTNSGPYWPPGPQPPVHEGFIPDGRHLDHTAIADDDDDNHERFHAALAAEYGIQDLSLLDRAQDQPQDTSDIGMTDGEVSDDDQPGDNVNLVVDQSHSQADLDYDDSDIDSDQSSDQDSSDGSSLDSDRLDRAIADADADIRGASQAARGRGRGRGRGGKSTRGRKGWKWAVAGTAHDPTHDRPKGRRGRPPGPRSSSRGEGRRKTNHGPKAVEPTPEFKTLLSQAYAPFLSGDFETAAGFARQAIECNPEIFAAHSLLSEILAAQGKEGDALLALEVGAFVQRDPEVWKGLAERSLALAGENRTQEVLDAAVLYYRKALGREKNDYDSLREKLNLELELYSMTRAQKYLAAARTDCKSMLKERSADLPVVRQYAELVALTGEPTKIKQAKTYFDTAFETYSKGATLGSEQWSYINIYVDLIETLDGPAEALIQLKRLARWLLGRSDETFWDDYIDDDQEFDVESDPRRDEVTEHSLTDHWRYGASLPLDLRVKMGLFRVAMGHGHLAEGLLHLEPLLSHVESINDCHDLFREAAHALKLQGHCTEAIRFYEPLQDDPDAPDAAYYMDLAACYLTVGRATDAEDCFKVIVDDNTDHIASRLALCKIYVTTGRREQALPLVNQLIKMGRNDALKQADIGFSLQGPTHGTAPISLSGEDVTNQPRTLREGPRRQRPITIQSEKQRKASERLQASRTVEQRIKANHEILESCREAVQAGDETSLTMWMTSAASMIADFRATRVFYPGRDKHTRFSGYKHYNKNNKLIQELEAMRGQLENVDGVTDEAQRLRDGIPNDFHDISFLVWLDIFCEYGLRLAQAGRMDECYDTLQNCYLAIVFYHDPAAASQIHATWLACALILNDEDKLCSVSRWFMTQSPYSAEPYQLFAAVNRLYPGSPEWFNSGPIQKYLLRAIKAMDYAVLSPEQREQYSFTAAERGSYTNGGRRKPNYMGLTELDAGLLTVYGHIMAAAQTWPSALNYYFRAYVLEPENVTLNLCIALSYIQNAMKRQTVNRHWQVLQGLSFLNRYYHLRTRAGVALHQQEAEYNIGRAWHFLGINHHAITGYERCLDLSERVKQDRRIDESELEVEDFSREAAMCLVGLYSLSDNLPAAKEITNKFLII